MSKALDFVKEKYIFADYASITLVNGTVMKLFGPLYAYESTDSSLLDIIRFDNDETKMVEKIVVKDWISYSLKSTEGLT